MAKYYHRLSKTEALELHQGDFVYFVPGMRYTAKVPAIVSHNGGGTLNLAYLKDDGSIDTTSVPLDKINVDWHAYLDAGATVETPEGTLLAVPRRDDTYPGIEIRLVQHGDDPTVSNTLLSMTEYTGGGELLEEDEFPVSMQLKQENLKRTVPVAEDSDLRRTTPGLITRNWTDFNLHNKHVKTLHRGYRLVAGMKVDRAELEHILRNGTHPEIMSQDVEFDCRWQRMRIAYTRDGDGAVGLMATLKDAKGQTLSSRKYDGGLEVRTVELKSGNVHYVVEINMK